MPADLRRPAILFDAYLTLIDIETDEGKLEVWDRLAMFLAYHDIAIKGGELRDRYFTLAELSHAQSPERYPEIDVLGAFTRLLEELSAPRAVELAPELARLFRVLSMMHIRLFPDVFPALRRLRPHYQLGIVSDAQGIFFWPEVGSQNLRPWMDVVVISGDHGFSKPDPRLFHIALSQLNTPVAQATYVGDNVERDICGARAADIRGVLINRTGKPVNTRGGCHADRTVRSLHELCDWLMGSSPPSGDTR